MDRRTACHARLSPARARPADARAVRRILTSDIVFSGTKVGRRAFVWQTPGSLAVLVGISNGYAAIVGPRRDENLAYDAARARTGKMRNMRNEFRFGLEAEFLLVDANSFLPLSHRDLRFQTLNDVLEGIPVEDFDCSRFKIE